MSGGSDGAIAAASTPIAAVVSKTWTSTRLSIRVAPLYVKNRRDGSRLLSTALVFCTVGLIRFDHPVGRWVFLLAGAISLYWGFCYGRLDH